MFLNVRIGCKFSEYVFEVAYVM